MPAMGGDIKLRIVGAEAGPPDLLAWAREMLPEYFECDSAPFHAELFDDLAHSDKRLIARVAPRGHAKSTCASLAYPLWCICEQKRRNIVIITHTAELARQFLRDIRTELETNPRIRARYGDLCRPTTDPEPSAEPDASLETSPPAEKPKRKTAKSSNRAAASPARSVKRPASHANRTKSSPARRKSTLPTATQSAAARAARTSPAKLAKKTAAQGTSARAARSAAAPSRRRWSSVAFTTTTGITVQARGVGAQLRGTRVGAHRPDLIICDDIEHDQQVESPAGREKLELWLRRVVMPAMHPQGRLIVLGSLLHYDSLLANLANPKKFPGWDHRVYRAIECEQTPAGEYRRKALWPARWPLERLDEERQRIGTLAFEQEYQANPIDASRRAFRPEWLRRYSPQELEGRELTNLIAVDPATGATEGDYFALWVGSVDTSSGVIYTRLLSCERIGVIDQVRRIVAAFEEWRPVKIGIETVAYQDALRQVLEAESRHRGLYLPLTSIRMTGSKRGRIAASAVFYEKGLFRLPETLDPEVEAQFLQFPKGDHDDAPDVCSMGIELARSLRTGSIEGMVPNRAIGRKGWNAW
jgi:predicted phage terminase large subunit-like protein